MSGSARIFGGRAAVAVLLLGAILTGCAGAPPGRDGAPVEPPASTSLPTATPATAPTVDPPAPTDPPQPVAPEPAPAPRSEPVPAPPAPGGTTAQASIEGTIVALANEARAAAGVGALQRHSGLDGVARGWSEHLASGGLALAHNPSYSAQIPGGWSAAGENVGWIDEGGRYSADAVAQAVHRGWMDSEGHRVNLLNPAFTHLGVGVVHGPNGYYLTQNFAAY